MAFMRTLTLATVAAAMVSPAVSAESTQTFYLNPHVAYKYFDDKRDLSESGIRALGAEFRFAPNWAAEVVYSESNVDRKYVAGNSKFNDIRLDGIYYFAGQDEAWNPYLSLGAGQIEFEDDPIGYQSLGTDHEETRVNLGGGFRYNVSDSISIRGDLREFHGIGEDTFDTQVSLGVSFAFNRTTADSTPGPSAPMDSDNDGVADNRDQCPGTPAGASVTGNGCEQDSDGDGVPDSRDQCGATPAGLSVDSRGCELDDDNDGVLNDKDQCPGTAPGAKVDMTGCEGVVETVKTIEVDVQFPSNSSVIDDRYDSEIRKVADFLRENPQQTVEIAGHSDSRGDADYNRFLSQRRANAVAQRLTDVLGISESRVTAVGYGEEQPIASNDTAAGRAENRRVEARFQVKR